MHTIQDSVKVTDAEVKEERLSYMVTQIGSLDKVIKYYKKNTEEEFRSYFFDILKENKFRQKCKRK
jgi:peptidyl-prolyl cis-trans isomerase SurA